MYIYKNVISRAMFLNVFLLYLSLDTHTVKLVKNL